MKTSLRLGAAAAALGLIGSGALADEFDGPDCTGSYRNSDGQPYTYLLDGCSRGRIDTQVMIHTETALATALARSFHIADEAQEPGDLDESSEPDEAQLDAIVGQNMHAKPVADTPAATARWNSWIDGKYTYNDANKIAQNQDGDLWNGLAGIDYKLTSKFTVGLMGSGEYSDLKGPLSSLKTSGAGLGPYIGYTLGDHIVLSASLLGSGIDSHQTDILTGNYHFASTRLQATTGATGYWYAGGWRLSPGVSMSWSKEWLKENDHLLPDHTVEIAMLTPSFQTGRTFKLLDTTTVEPWAGAAWDWTFYSRVKYDGQPAIEEPTKDLRLQAGLNFSFGQHAQLALTGEMGGLVNTSVRTYAGEANLAFQF